MTYHPKLLMKRESLEMLGLMRSCQRVQFHISIAPMVMARTVSTPEFDLRHPGAFQNADGGVKRAVNTGPSNASVLVIRLDS
ncbi:MAG: hypothetical protein E2586_09760 [Novosphingobium sp.]|uniref:hypothetical protein n=1 Tax=Novosphingobium sp. TaxID=1874826 RepID=UPI0012C9467B|nr:hypothetical protein [Novosphingobium sp.]MPS68770.1 hypothetical protein [Novosphingobium sp.]